MSRPMRAAHTACPPGYRFAIRPALFLPIPQNLPIPLSGIPLRSLGPDFQRFATHAAYTRPKVLTISTNWRPQTTSTCIHIHSCCLFDNFISSATLSDAFRDTLVSKLLCIGR